MAYQKKEEELHPGCIVAMATAGVSFLFNIPYMLMAGWIDSWSESTREDVFVYPAVLALFGVFVMAARHRKVSITFITMIPCTLLYVRMADTRQQPWIENFYGQIIRHKPDTNYHDSTIFCMWALVILIFLIAEFVTYEVVRYEEEQKWAKKDLLVREGEADEVWYPNEQQLARILQQRRARLAQQWEEENLV